MSTRGAIGRLVQSKNGGVHFKAVYHHWDSYPTGLGKTLWDLYHGHFKEDLKAMLKFLIDDHKAGWSTINGKDFSLPAGFDDEKYKTPKAGEIVQQKEKSEGPECYCHGTRNEKPWVVTEENAAGSGVEWVYAFDVRKKEMHILSSYCDPKGECAGQKMIGAWGMGDPKAFWKDMRIVKLDDYEPEWELIGEVAE